MPLGLSGCCQDKKTLFRDVFSFLMTVTGEGAGGRHRLKKRVRCFMARFRESSVSSGFTFPALINGSCLANSVCCSMGLRSRLPFRVEGQNTAPNFQSNISLCGTSRPKMQSIIRMLVVFRFVSCESFKSHVQWNLHELLHSTITYHISASFGSFTLTEIIVKIMVWKKSADCDLSLPFQQLIIIYTQTVLCSSLRDTTSFSASQRWKLLELWSFIYVLPYL